VKEPEPDEWVDQFMRLPRERQVEYAERIIANARVATACVIENHTGGRGSRLRGGPIAVAGTMFRCPNCMKTTPVELRAMRTEDIGDDVGSPLRSG
jgi:hypothetical protein